MSSPDPSACVSLPGRLYLGVTNAGLAAAVAPFGGAALGIKTHAKIVRSQSYVHAESEAFGRNEVRTYGGRYAMSFVFVVIQKDATIRRKIWAYSTTSPNSYANAEILTLPKAGQTTVPTGVVAPSTPLLFAPDDLDQDALVILAPIWTLGPKLELDRVLDKPDETAIVVVVGLDSSNNDVRMAPVYNLAVT